jgi:signal transduction histidine kinase
VGRRRLIDAAIVIVVFFFTAGMLGGEGERAHEATRTRDALGLCLAVATALPLLLRRRTPVGAFALSALPSALISGLGYPPGPPLGPTVALFFVGRQPPVTQTGRRVTALTVASVYALHVAASSIGQDGPLLVPVLLGALIWGGAWVAGDRVRQRHERAEERRGRADRERQLAVAEERTRIARDLHDSAGHALNVILVQSGAARLLAQKDPVQARVALETIESVARETVDEIDRMVRVLREDGGGTVDPPIGLAALDRLVARHAEAGLDVNFTVRGEHRPLARAVDQAAYRIVQESLTNAARHGASGAELEVAYGERGLEISVTNAARHDIELVEGHGIVGMRERAALLGGRIDITNDHGIFRVRAALPYDGGAP